MQKGIKSKTTSCLLFGSPTVTTSGGKKNDLIQTVILTVRKMNLLIHIKIDQNLH